MAGMSLMSTALFILGASSLLSSIAGQIFTGGNSPPPPSTPAGGQFTFNETDLSTEEALLILYYRWRDFYSKSNSSNPNRKFQTFKSNAKYIYAFNKNNTATYNYKLGLNRFGDMTDKEIAHFFSGSKNKPDLFNGTYNFSFENVTDLPSFVDWRTQGAMTPVKDEGDCDSSWAFSTIASVESWHKLNTGELISLSEQQLLDCVYEGNQGCKGGRPEDAFEWIKKNGGVTSEANYPYKAAAGKCDASKLNSSVVTINSWETIPVGNMYSLLQALSIQPLSCYSSMERDFCWYYEGLIRSTAPSSDPTRFGYYAANLIGWEMNMESHIYIVRNSWGSGFGENGYIRLDARRYPARCMFPR